MVGGGGGGGGPKCWLTIMHISMVENKALRSTAHGVLQTPTTDLYLMERGGSGMEYFSGGPFSSMLHKFIGSDFHHLSFLTSLVTP
jgi:hypothetical protein